MPYSYRDDHEAHPGYSTAVLDAPQQVCACGSVAHPATEGGMDCLGCAMDWFRTKIAAMDGSEYVGGVPAMVRELKRLEGVRG